MSDMVQSCLLEESKIVLTVEIPVNVDASEPLEHLKNEGQIEQAVLDAGRAASQAMYQGIADRHNARECYHNQEGYKLRQKYQSTEEFVTPYGAIRITSPYFCNDHKKLSDTPFKSETLMEDHHITPMAQYVLLRMLAKQGPEASAKDFEEDRGVVVSHHLVDTFLEDMGVKYQDLREEFLDEVVREDWRPSWRPCLLPESPSSGEAPREENVTLFDSLVKELGQEIMPVVQVDAMNVRIREYEERLIDGKKNHQKYQVKFRQLHNAFIGFQTLGGPREANDPLSFQEVRYMSEYFEPDRLPQDAADHLRRCGVEPGSPVVCMGDGDKKIWPRYANAFADFARIDVLDTRHCQKNLKLFSEWRYPDEPEAQTGWVQKRMDDLFEGRYDAFFEGLNYAIRTAPTEEAKEDMKSKRKYFTRNKNGIRYKHLLEAGYPISTCFVESAHNHVMGDRVRKNGRSYRDDRLQIVADFRAEYKSNRLPYVFGRILEIEAQKAA